MCSGVGKALFDVSLPKPGVYKLLISASVEGSPFTRVLTYYLNAQSDFIAPQPVAVAPAFVVAGVRPLSHLQQVISIKDQQPCCIKWHLPAGWQLKATLKENASKLDPEKYIRVHRDQEEITFELSLPVPKIQKGRPAVQLPAYTLALFARHEGDSLGFKFVTTYIIQVVGGV